MRQSFFNIPFWKILWFGCVLVLVAVVIIPLHELRALTKSVVFFNGSSATIAWDPPDSGVVDHYIVEMTISRLFDGPQNTVTWVDYFSTREPRYVLPTDNGHSYVLRVKAVGPNGNESPYSEERLTLICDSESPEISVTPLHTVDGKVRTRELELNGSFYDDNLAYIRINDRVVDLDIVGNTWHVKLPLKEGLNEITIEANDYAGNVKRQSFKVRQQPIVFSSKPSQADLFVLGTPAYPGIYLGTTPYKVFGVIDPTLRIPISLRRHGWTGIDQVVSVPADQDEFIFSMPALRLSYRFDVMPLPSLDPAWTGSELIQPFPVDYDQDNSLDILIGTSLGYVVLLPSLPHGEDSGWGEPILLNTPEGRPLNLESDAVPFLIDMDSDFAFDLVVGNDAGGLAQFRKEGDAWRPEESLDIEASISLHGLHFAFVDWNLDHKKDLLLANDNGQLEVLLNTKADSAPFFGPESVSISLPGWKTGAPFAVADWNGDEKFDIIAQNRYGALVVWQNTGSLKKAQFTVSASLIRAEELDASLLAPAVVDWNRDGMQDLVVGTDTGRLFLLLGQEE